MALDELVQQASAGERKQNPNPRLAVTLLTGGSDPHYAFGLARALASKGVQVEMIGGDQDENAEIRRTQNITFVNLHRRLHGSLLKKLGQIIGFYWRLIRHAARTKTRIFHILWNNKFEYFDRTFLTLYYKLLGKKIVFTAHNVNAGSRDLKDSWLNRLTLKIQYQLSDHVLVHTEKMKQELISEFGVDSTRVSIIPYGVNDAVPNTKLTCAQAKEQLGISQDDKTILFFGAIKPYKGVEYLVEAFGKLIDQDVRYRLIIAGERKKGHEQYWDDIQATIDRNFTQNQVLQRIEFIPDGETEIYFKASDVTVLPYTQIFQSGILFLAYSFGLPVIASDVGSFRSDIIDGETGFICKPKDADELCAAIQQYFGSELYSNLDVKRQDIRASVNREHSWEYAADITSRAYASLAGNPALVSTLST